MGSYTGNRLRRFGLLLLCSCSNLVPPQCFGATLPPPFTASYGGEKRVLLFDVKAQATVQLQRLSQYIRYTSQSEINWSFYSRQFYDCSILRLQGDRLYAVEYLHTDSSDAKYNVRTTFDWETGQAVTVRGDKPEPRQTALEWPTWDPLSLQVAIISEAPDQPPGSVQQHKVISRGKLRQYQVRFNGEVRENLPANYHNLVEVVTAKRDGDGRLLLAPGYQWVPVTIEVDEVKIELQNPPELGKVITASATDVPSCEPH